MKRSICIIFFVVHLFPWGYGQTDRYKEEDILLTELLTSGKMPEYFKQIKLFGDSAYSKKDGQRLSDLGNYLRQPYIKLDSISRKSLRISAMYMGSKTWKLSGDHNKALTYYLIAHENAINKFYLDSLAWYIENEISKIYTMLGDFENAQYYANLLEKSLIQFGMIELLTRHYSNIGRKLKSEYKYLEAFEIFKKGYRIADSLKYYNGMFANTYNLSELLIDFPSLGSPETYLDSASRYIESLRDDARYLIKKSWLEKQIGRYKSQIHQYGESLLHFFAAIELLSQYHGSSSRRDFAQHYCDLAEVYYLMDSLEASNKAIQDGMNYLIPGYSLKDEIPAENLLYPENVFVKLFTLKGNILEKKFNSSRDINYLLEGLKWLDLALKVNDMIRDNAISDQSKLIAIQKNKELVENAIHMSCSLYNMQPNLEYFDLARGFFNRSKSLLYNEKSYQHALVNLMREEDKAKWNELKRRIYDLNDKRFQEGEDENLINGEILKLQNAIDSLFIPYYKMIVLITKPTDYIES